MPPRRRREQLRWPAETPWHEHGPGPGRWAPEGAHAGLLSKIPGDTRLPQFAERWAQKAGNAFEQREATRRHTRAPATLSARHQSVLQEVSNRSGSIAYGDFPESHHSAIGGLRDWGLVRRKDGRLHITAAGQARLQGATSAPAPAGSTFNLAPQTRAILTSVHARGLSASYADFPAHADRRRVVELRNMGLLSHDQGTGRLALTELGRGELPAEMRAQAPQAPTPAAPAGPRLGARQERTLREMYERGVSSTGWYNNTEWQVASRLEQMGLIQRGGSAYRAGFTVTPAGRAALGIPDDGLDDLNDYQLIGVAREYSLPGADHIQRYSQLAPGDRMRLIRGVRGLGGTAGAWRTAAPPASPRLGVQQQNMLSFIHSQNGQARYAWFNARERNAVSRLEALGLVQRDGSTGRLTSTPEGARAARSGWTIPAGAPTSAWGRQPTSATRNPPQAPLPGPVAIFTGNETMAQMVDRYNGTRGARHPDDQAVWLAKARSVWNYTDPQSGLTAKVGAVHAYGGDNVEVTGHIYDSNGNSVGRFTRRIFSDGHIYHAFFETNRSIQAGGFTTRWFDAILPKYRAEGINAVEVSANIDVGGYAWTKWFDFKNRSDAASLLRMFESRGASSRGRADPFRTPEVDREIAELRRRFDAGEWITPAELANVGRSQARVDIGAGGVRTNMWFGKAAMLGTGWSGRMTLSGPVRRRMSRPRP